YRVARRVIGLGAVAKADGNPFAQAGGKILRPRDPLEAEGARRLVVHDDLLRLDQRLVLGRPGDLDRSRPRAGKSCRGVLEGGDRVGPSLTPFRRAVES